MALATTRAVPCIACDAPVRFLSCTNTHPECPEFIQLPEGAWAYWVQGDHAPELYIMCSEACMRVVTDSVGV